MANFLLAIDQDLEIVAILNKIDLPAADPDKVAEEVEEEPRSRWRRLHPR